MEAAVAALLAAQGVKLTENEIARATDEVRAVLLAIREPTPAMLDRFVSRALQVSVHGEGGWSEYGRNQWQAMIDAALTPKETL